MNKFEINPFDRGALTDSRLLAGRANEFRQIRFILRNAANSANRIKHILISGERGVGKTSFLNLIEAEATSNNLIPIRVNLTASNSINSNELFWYIFSQLTNTVFDLSLLGGKGGPIDINIQNILYTRNIDDVANLVFRTPVLRKNYLTSKSPFEFDSFIRDLKLLRQELTSSSDLRFNEKTKFIILVDEAQHIYSNISIIEEIRYIVQSEDLGIGFVFAGDNTFVSSNWENVFGGSYRIFELINLDSFNDIEDVIDYFRKSLTSINWTSKEIEEDLFYKFRKTSSEIFRLTSGKPAWINVIASRMFERCMKGEAPLLRLDKQVRSDIKKLLEDSGQLDQAKLDFVESSSKKRQKWLSALFECELNTFRQVYFYAKFILVDDCSMSLEEYKDFCQTLIDKGIISIIAEDAEVSIGYRLRSKEIDLLDMVYYAFDFKTDIIKQWLQIDSDGEFSFNTNLPQNYFIKQINNSLVLEDSNPRIILSKNDFDEPGFELDKVIKDINNTNYNATEEHYYNIDILYKTCKILSESRERYILHGELRDNISETSYTWNVVNYDEKHRVIGFYENPARLMKFEDAVVRHNTGDQNYKLLLRIVKVDAPDMSKLQESIIKTDDKKKIGIVFDDKGADLIRFYIRESNEEASYATAMFFYNLFEEGYDLDLRNLNNTAYVLTSKGEFEKASKLLNDARQKINFSYLDKDEQGTAVLIFYNLAIIEAREKNYYKSLELFKKVIELSTAREIDHHAAVLEMLVLNEVNEIELREIKDADVRYNKINCINIAKENISVIEKYLPLIE